MFYVQLRKIGGAGRDSGDMGHVPAIKNKVNFTRTTPPEVFYKMHLSKFR